MIFGVCFMDALEFFGKFLDTSYIYNTFRYIIDILLYCIDLKTIPFQLNLHHAYIPLII